MIRKVDTIIVPGTVHCRVLCGPIAREKAGGNTKSMPGGRPARGSGG
jgi:hypothetical protein